jgi:hypothetical protein
MASTTGGFLLGFGCCVLILSLGGYVVWSQYQGLTRWRGAIKNIYDITHTGGYGMWISYLEGLAPYSSSLADIMRRLPGLQSFADQMQNIQYVGPFMRQLRDDSESAYEAIYTFDILPQYLLYVSVFGISLVVLGIVLVVRGRKKKELLHPSPSLNVPIPPPPSQVTTVKLVCLKCGYVVSPDDKFCHNCGASL